MDSSVFVLVFALLFLFSVKSQQIADPQLPGSPSPPLSPSHPPKPPSLVSPPRKPVSPAVEGTQLNKHLKTPPVKEKTNLGKKIGLMFVGVASVLQICIVAFLFISRRYLLRPQNGYQRN